MEEVGRIFCLGILWKYVHLYMLVCPYSHVHTTGPQSTPFQLYGFMDHPAFLFYWIDVEICSQNSLNFTYCRSKKPTILMYRLTFIIF
jgi:hypothetical protein